MTEERCGGIHPGTVAETGVRMVAERFLTIEPAEVDAVAPQINIVLN